MKQYQPEKGEGEATSKRNIENIEVGRGVKKPSLHGNHTLEDKKKYGDNEPNKVDLDDDMALEIRKAVTLDYIEGGGDGRGDQISEHTSKFKSDNPEWIVHNEVDELYPSASED